MNIHKTIYVLLLLTIAATFSHAQIMNPVRFSSELQQTSGDQGEIVFHGVIDDGWHVYSTDIGNGGPTPATFHAVKMEGIEPIGKIHPREKAKRKYDEMFQMEVSFFEHEVTFVQPVRFTKSKYSIDCFLEYGTCNNEMCLPPTEVSLKKSGEITFEEKKEENKESVEETQNINSADTIHTTGTIDAIDTIRTISSTDTVKTIPASAPTAPLKIFLLGLLGGLLAVMMPCIWPIIPMTVSFFMKRAASRRRGLRDAVLYGLSIIIIYVGLGLAVTALFGSDALNALSTNAVVNVLLFLVLIVFGLSLLGIYELNLPSSWSTAIDRRASSTTGMVSIFLMALTLVVVSFSCTAPIIGLLLVETATGGSYLSPAVGMTGFAIALALPFTLFALFPSWLKELPRSGPWMNMLKVTLGFIEIAFSLKFLSVADQAYGWHLLSRNLFLVLWIIIFTLLGIYLIREKVKGIARVVAITGAVASLALAIYMVPGLWGAPCTLVSAFAPPMEAVKAHYNDYDKGMAAARRENKPVLIDFTGYGCVNCRKMEAAVWTDPRVASILKNDYILISLYVDDKTPLNKPIDVTVAGKKKTLRTVGAKWSYLESSKFGSNAQPFYVILSHDGRLMASPRGYDENVDEYLLFLRSGLKGGTPHSN